jgi:hypothetical protein
MPGKLYDHTMCQGNLISSASLVFGFFVLFAMDLVHQKKKRKTKVIRTFLPFVGIIT